MPGCDQESLERRLGLVSSDGEDWHGRVGGVQQSTASDSKRERETEEGRDMR